MGDDLGGKVHIPHSFENSDFDSETLSDRIRKIDGYGDLGQGYSKQGKGEDSHQIWCMDNTLILLLVRASNSITATKKTWRLLFLLFWIKTRMFLLLVSKWLSLLLLK